MEYFSEYILKLDELKRGEKTKFDVSLIVAEPTKSFCVGMNEKINNYVDGEIKFSEESIIFPHISLFMGFIDSFDMLAEVFKVVNRFSKNTAPFNLDYNKMYFKGVSPTAAQYLFVDPLQNDYLMKQKEIIDNHLSDLVYPIGWNMKEEQAHITIGCYKNLTSNVRKMIDFENAIPSCRISQVGISLTGNRGVCLGLLKVFDLTGN